MGAGGFRRAPAGEPPRLVAQPDGFADYADPFPAADSSRRHGRRHYSLVHGIFTNWPGYVGRRRGARGHRQRSIRSTITVLLVIPLLSLIGLWVYAAEGTVGGAMGERDANIVNTDIGAPLEGLIEQLAVERADTFVWQSADGHLPRGSMLAQRPRTDAAIAALRAGAAAAFGVEPSADRPVAQALLRDLGQIGTLRAEVDARKISPLAAFQAYNAMANGIYPFAGALSNPEASIQLYQESQALLEEGESADDVGQEATLMAGAFAAGDRMSAAEQRAFVQSVDNQRLLEQLGDSPLDWQQSPDPYSSILTSSAFTGLSRLQDEIIATSPGAPLRVSPMAWQASVGSVTAELTTAETTARLGVTRGDTHASDVILLRLILVGGAGLMAVVISSLLLLRFGNRISRELTGLRGAARTLAGERLPSVVRRLRAGDEVDVDTEAPPLVLETRTREVTETADAFSAVQRTAVEAAVEQARLRKGVSLVFRSLARRNQSLVQRQLRMLDEMERGTDDPEELARLFRLDHLTTRMRRQAEGLIILSGAAPGRGWRQPVPVIEVLRGALGEIEDFARIDMVTDSPDFLQGAGVADVTHLLAELIENAVLYSPPATRVKVRCGRVANGYVIEIEDRALAFRRTRWPRSTCGSPGRRSST
jgi:signal transduction histidine kinase